MKSIKVSVIILNWNGLKLLKKYFKSLINQNFNDYEIIFFDNNSSDKSIDYINKIKLKTKSKITIVKNTQNDGTAKASNEASKYAKGKYLFFVSNDMIFDRNIIRNLYEYYCSNPEVGIATVKMLRNINENKTNIIDSMGANIDLIGNAISVNIHKKLNKVNDQNSEVFFSFGGALFIKKKLFKKVKGFDERYFTLSDDIDLCWRVRLLNFKVNYINKSYIYHRVSATLSNSHNRHIKRFFSERNNLCSIIKNYSLNLLIIIIPIYLCISILEIIFFLLMFRFKISYVPIKSIIWNIKNLKETLIKRKYIQNTRTVSDMSILKLTKFIPQKFIYGYEFFFNRKNWKNYFN